MKYIHLLGEVDRILKRLHGLADDDRRAVTTTLNEICDAYLNVINLRRETQDERDEAQRLTAGYRGSYEIACKERDEARRLAEKWRDTECGSRPGLRHYETLPWEG
jgi:hypothetical protein